ncbi:MAG: MFS transporter, partial [Chryseobacterium sp.]|nr:MFS transporter [Candidatus Chryseobacterium enterohippi]
MKSRGFTLFVIYCLAFLTGINFVVFPALGTVLTDNSIFKLSSAQFGNLFIPQVVCIIISSILAPFLVNKWGPKLILIIGSILMLLATGGLWILQFVIDQTQILFPLLLVLAAFAGFGFGMNVTTLNPLAASFFKEKQSSAILILQFLVGLGTSTSPLMLTLL